MCNLCKDGHMVLHTKGCVGYIGNDKCPKQEKDASDEGYKGFIFCTQCNEVIRDSNPIWAYAITMGRAFDESDPQPVICPKCGNEESYMTRGLIDPPSHWQQDLSKPNTEEEEDDNDEDDLTKE